MRGREMPRGGGETPSNPQSPLRITHDGEFYARLLTRESSLANPSFRYYGAGSGAVPFGWESQPGTPKDASCRMLAATAAAVVPAITPPPSYHLRAGPHGHSGRPGGGGKRRGVVVGDKNYGGRSKYCGYKLKWIKIGFIAAVFRRLTGGKSQASSSSSSVQSSSSTRWLFSGSSCSLEETGAHHYHYEQAMKGMLCLGVRPSPWMVQFCGGRREAGWVHAWL